MKPQPTLSFGSRRVVGSPSTSYHAPVRAASVQVASEVFAADARPDLYVELSTLSPATMQDLAARAEAAGVGFLDAPVSGNVRARTEGTLAVMAGGDEASF